MVRAPSKNTPRISVLPGGIAAFADSGAVAGKETAEQLIARMNTKYGLSNQTEEASAQQPAPQAPPPQKTPPRPEQQGILGGIIGTLKGRQQQIDKAAGYSSGGKISGPGTAKSDSIPASVRETGEGIRVSNGERIVSAEQGKFLEAVAQNAGYKSLDAMLEDGTGKPVGPTIKGGKRAAADGLAPELDPFAYRGAKINAPIDPKVSAGIAAPPTLGGTIARTEPAGGALSSPADGLTVTPFDPKPDQLGSGLQGISRGIADFPAASPTKPGRDANGVITADSAKAAMGNDMQRSGGIFGTMDLAAQNDRTAKALGYANADDFNKQYAQRQGGIGILGGEGPTEVEKINAERTNRWRQDDLISLATRGNQGAIAEAIRANDRIGAQQVANEDRALNRGLEMARLGITARGQDLKASAANAEQDALNQRAADRLSTAQRGQDMRAGTAADRIASNENIAAARSAGRSGPTLGQQRANAEIDAARERVVGMDPNEIKRRTANYTSTGRENPDFDPTLAKAASLANRRKVGADDAFDQRQQAGDPAGTDGDVMTRFRADQDMKGHKTGKVTEQGVEVFDASGRLIGHYR